MAWEGQQRAGRQFREREERSEAYHARRQKEMEEQDPPSPSLFDLLNDQEESDEGLSK